MRLNSRLLLRSGVVTSGLVLISGLIGAMPAQAAPAAPTDGPAAIVSGPIETTDDSYPFMSPEGPEAPPIETVDPIEVDLGAHDYVEEEFFLQGTAKHYDSDTGEAVDSSPYMTRMVVRRPADTADFSGTTFLEWNNVSFGQDIEIDWSNSNEYFMRSGHVWVGLSAQQVGVNALRDWDLDRYGELDVGGPELDDAPAFDILSQTARTLRSPEGVDPLPDIDVEEIIATGHSQSARYLATYHNNVHPQHGEIDGFMIHGAPTELEESQTPAMRLMAEGDVRSQFGSQEEDSEYFRRWEVAGTSHVAYKDYRTFAPLISREFPNTDPQECERPPLSRIPFHYVQNAAYDHLVDWVTDGDAPPKAPRLEWDGPLTPSRDAHDNRLGGIRLAEHEVATALNDGANSGDPFCFLQGAHIPFDDATLKELYPKRGNYLLAMNWRVSQAMNDGYLLHEDAYESRRAAWQVDYDWW